MISETQGPPSKAMMWAGWVLSVLPSLLLFMSGGMKLVKPEMLEEMGFPARLGLTLGIVEIGCDRTLFSSTHDGPGRILLTGYLGGAVATHARVLEVGFLVPLILGMLVWGGLFLRDPRVRCSFLFGSSEDWEAAECLSARRWNGGQPTSSVTADRPSLRLPSRSSSTSPSGSGSSGGSPRTTRSGRR